MFSFEVHEIGRHFLDEIRSIIGEHVLGAVVLFCEGLTFQLGDLGSEESEDGFFFLLLVPELFYFVSVELLFDVGWVQKGDFLVDVNESFALLLLDFSSQTYQSVLLRLEGLDLLGVSFSCVLIDGLHSVLALDQIEHQLAVGLTRIPNTCFLLAAAQLR